MPAHGDVFRLEKKNDFEHLTFIDLFAGIGGFHVALARRGARCVFASEKDPEAALTYERNHGLKPAGDITAIDAADIPAHDILCAGFPCQPFSLSGSRGGFNDERGRLFFDIVRIVRHHRPRVVLLENVTGLISHDGGNTFETMRNLLVDAGYSVHHRVVKGRDVGLPQDRDRLFVLCLRSDIDVARFPTPLPMPYAYVVDDILEYERDHEIDNSVGFSAPFVKTGEFDGDADRKHRIGGYGRQCQGARVYDPRGRGVTLCSSGGGGGALTGIYLINGRHRTLTSRECARMSGFPDTFILHDSEKTAIRQFGNTVLPAAVDFMLEMLVSALPQLHTADPAPSRDEDHFEEVSSPITTQSDRVVRVAIFASGTAAKHGHPESTPGPVPDRAHDRHDRGLRQTIRHLLLNPHNTPPRLQVRSPVRPRAPPTRHAIIGVSARRGTASLTRGTRAIPTRCIGQRSKPETSCVTTSRYPGAVVAPCSRPN